MKKIMFVMKSLAQLAKINYKDTTIAFSQLESMKANYTKALAEGIIDKDDYKTLINSLEETKINVLKTNMA